MPATQATTSPITHSSTTAPVATTSTAPAPTAFATPGAAVEAFVAAARADDVAALLALLGPDGQDVLDSGDPVADGTARANFCRAYDAKHEINQDGPGATLLVGEALWPMPIPIVQDAAGWRFDAAAGRDEILDRRIGRNERDAMKVLLAIIDAQLEFARTPGDGVPAYADRFASTPGKRDGLYWPTKPGEPPSPLGPLIEQAADEGYADPSTQPTTSPAVGPRTPYHGYYYRLLLGQGPAAPHGESDYRINGRMLGGFAVLAWPADYGNSGVMSFLVNQTGVIYQRDFGEKTTTEISHVLKYDPTPEWKLVDPSK